MIWFFSDEHYGHRGIIQYADRPFGGVEEMDWSLATACQQDVNDGDLVWHLGDVGRLPRAALMAILGSLPGTHALVRGNHDRGADAMRALGFAVVVERAMVRLDGQNILLSHRPVYDPLPEGVAGVFHGHIHQGYPADLVRAGERPDIPPWNVNLCVEKTDYRPISCREALKRLRKQTHA